MKWSVENFKKGPLMTALGVLLIIGSAVVFVMKEDSEAYCLALLGAGVGCLGLKDPTIPPSAGGVSPLVFLLIIILMALALGSCVTAKKCADKFGTEPQHVTIDTTITVRFDTVPPEVVDDGLINGDSMMLLQLGRIDSLREISEDGKIETQYWKDQYTNAIRYRSKCKPDTIKITKEVPFKVTADCPPVVVVDPEQDQVWYARVWMGFKLFAAYLVLAEVLLLVIVGAMFWIRNRVVK